MENLVIFLFIILNSQLFFKYQKNYNLIKICKTKLTFIICKLYICFKTQVLFHQRSASQNWQGKITTLYYFLVPVHYVYANTLFNLLQYNFHLSSNRNNKFFYPCHHLNIFLKQLLNFVSFSFIYNVVYLFFIELHIFNVFQTSSQYFWPSLDGVLNTNHFALTTDIAISSSVIMHRLADWHVQSCIISSYRIGLLTYISSQLGTTSVSYFQLLLFIGV